MSQFKISSPILRLGTEEKHEHSQFAAMETTDLVQNSQRGRNINEINSNVLVVHERPYSTGILFPIFRGHPYTHDRRVRVVAAPARRSNDAVALQSLQMTANLTLCRYGTAEITDTS